MSSRPPLRSSASTSCSSASSPVVSSATSRVASRLTSMGPPASIRPGVGRSGHGAEEQRTELVARSQPPRETSSALNSRHLVPDEQQLSSSGRARPPAEVEHDCDQTSRPASAGKLAELSQARTAPLPMFQAYGTSSTFGEHRRRAAHGWPGGGRQTARPREAGHIWHAAEERDGERLPPPCATSCPLVLGRACAGPGSGRPRAHSSDLDRAQRRRWSVGVTSCSTLVQLKSAARRPAGSPAGCRSASLWFRPAALSASTAAQRHERATIGARQPRGRRAAHWTWPMRSSCWRKADRVPDARPDEQPEHAQRAQQQRPGLRVSMVPVGSSRSGWKKSAGIPATRKLSVAQRHNQHQRYRW